MSVLRPNHLLHLTAINLLISLLFITVVAAGEQGRSAAEDASAVDHLHLNTIAFPVLRGELYRARDASDDYRWGIEVHCGESPHLDYRSWPDDRDEGPLDWLAGSEPYLYAQMLPLRVTSPDELIGRAYSFPQSPDDEPADWPRGIGWPFFCLYLMEHDLAHPMRVAFTERRGGQYRVEIAGGYPSGGLVHDLRVEAWLDWQAQDAEQTAAGDGLPPSGMAAPEQ